MNTEEKKADFMRRFKASRERKAEYIAQVHNEYGIELKDIAEQIGDSNKITLKL